MSDGDLATLAAHLVDDIKIRRCDSCSGGGMVLEAFHTIESVAAAVAAAAVIRRPCCDCGGIGLAGSAIEVDTHTEGGFLEAGALEAARVEGRTLPMSRRRGLGAVIEDRQFVSPSVVSFAVRLVKTGQ